MINDTTRDSADAGPEDSGEGGATRFLFIDTEATGLDHARHELTEVSWIVRYTDGSEVERQYFPEHTLDGADDEALELTGYEQRIAPQDKTPAEEWLVQLLEDADGATIVGAVPDFDIQHLRRMCRKLQLQPTWDHHLVDVETLALPLIADGPETPRGLATTCRHLGIEHDEDRAHGALYDARQAMAVFDHVWAAYRRIRATGDTLPPPVPHKKDGPTREEDPAEATPAVREAGDTPRPSSGEPAARTTG